MFHRLDVRGAVALLLISLFCGPLWGRRVVSLKGTYDFDRDGLSEFLTIEEADPGAPYSKLAVFYEIDELGSHDPLWVFTTSFPITDAHVVDMDGNGAPEVVVLTGGPVLEGGDRPFGLLWFPWDQDSFSQSAAIEWNGRFSLEDRKPFSLTIIDSDNDSRDEIAIAVGSPNREIVLLTLNPRMDPPLFEISQILTSPTVSSGYGQIFLSTVDQNSDGFPDLFAIMRELSVLKVQLFANEGGVLAVGHSYQADVTQVSPQFSPLVPSGINTIDIDQDGAHEVFLPFKSGPPVAINASQDQLNLLPVEVEIASLFVFPATGMEESVINEILLERAESGITGMRARKLQLRAMEMEVPPTTPDETVEAATPEEPPARKVKHLELTAVEDTASPGPPPADVVDTTDQSVAVEPPVSESEEVTEEDVSPTPGRVRKLDLTTLEKAARTPAPVVPADVTVTDTVVVGETYSHPLEPDEQRALHAFRPSTLPPGAFFDPPSRAVVWTPSENQVGVHRLAYEVEFEVTGERVNVEQVDGTGVQVLTTTETDTVELYILVRSNVEP